MGFIELLVERLEETHAGSDLSGSQFIAHISWRSLSASIGMHTAYLEVLVHCLPRQRGVLLNWSKVLLGLNQVADYFLRNPVRRACQVKNEFSLREQ